MLGRLLCCRVTDDGMQTRAHLEAQLASALSLNSPNEYRQCLLSYVRFLARFAMLFLSLLFSKYNSDSLLEFAPLHVGQPDCRFFFYVPVSYRGSYLYINIYVQINCIFCGGGYYREK